MSLIQKIRKKVSSIDMFYSSQMLRYNKDSQYQTFTGGIVSIAVVIVVIAGFFNMISETINRTAISSTVNVITTSNPPAYQMITDTQSKFMFAVQIQSTDVMFNYQIGGQRRYFDLFITAYGLKYGLVQKQRKIELQPCTDAHFQMFPEVIKNKDYIMYQNWFCPHLGQKILLQGQYFSQDYASVVVSVSKCTNTSEPDRPCYPQEQIDALFEQHGNFYFSINYINTVINPTEVQYRSYYLETSDYLIFSKHIGAELHYLFSDYQIQTDSSIWPFSDIHYDQGLLLSSRPIERTYSVLQDSYAFIYVGKSPRSFQYKRQVQKLSAVFSYIGGLVGAISAVLFMVKIYTDTSLEIAIASDLFRTSQNKSDKIQEKLQKKQNSNDLTKQVNSKEECELPAFTIFSFIKFSLYQMLKSFKFTKSWSQARRFSEFRNEITHHLDIKVLLQRITNMERYVSYLFDNSQLTCLKHQEKMQINEIKRLREIFAAEQKQDMDEDQIDDTLTESPVFRVTEDALSNANSGNIGNNNLKEQIDNMSALNLQKDALEVKNSNNLQLPISRGVVRSAPRKTGLQIEQLVDFHRVKEQTAESVVSQRIWTNMKNKVKHLVESSNEDKKGEVSYINMKSRKQFRIEIIEPDERSS